MQVSTETVFLISKKIEKIGWIDLPAIGNSMFPFIRKDDICRFVACKPDDLKKGDIVLFYTSTGQLVAHRFYKTIIHNKEEQYLFKGDTNVRFDEPICTEQIIGELAVIQKKRVIIDKNSRIVRIWNWIICVPITSRLLRKYLVIVKA